MAAKDFEVSLLKYQNTPSLYPLKAPSSLFRFTTNNSVAVNFDDVSPQLLLELTHSLLSGYVQLNYTGPPTAEDSNSKLPFFEGGLDWTAANEQALSELSRLGEPAYYLVKQPLLLVLTLKLLGILHPGLPEDKKDTNLDESKAYPTPLSENYPLAHTILCHRATLLHLRLLDSPVPPQQWILSLPEPVDLASHPDLRATYLLTLSSLHLSITSPPISSEISKSREYLLKAIELEGLEYELTGIVGKRTKFQVEDKAQLVLLVKENGKEAIDYSIDGAKLPNLLQLNDDTLLEAPTYSLTSPLPVPKPAAPSLSSHILQNTMAALPFPPPPLHPRSQALLLHLLEHQRLGFSGKEQLSSYLAPILSAPSNWSVTTLALLERSRLEFGRSRTVERGVWQMRELREEVLNLEVATLNREQAMEEAKDRLRFFFDLPEFPSSWSLSKELGKAYYSLGVIKSALEVFASLHLWEDVIYCYLNLSSLDLGGQRGVDKGLEVVQQLIKGEKVESDEVMRMATTTTMDKNRLGKLYCLLGDLMGQDVASYEKAYEISKTPRAARSLGYAYYSRSDFRSSQEWFKRALAVHPLFTKAWFTLGCTNMRLEDWKEGVHAFSRCVSLEEEEGESWSNLGSCHLRLADQEAKEKKEDDALPKQEEEEDLANIGISKSSTGYDRKQSAFFCFKQAVKYSRDSYRMWQNLMTVAVEVGEFDEAVRAFNQIFDMRWDKDGENSIDLDVLDRLVDAALKDESPTLSLSKRIFGLVDTLLTRCSTSPRLFKAQARLLLHQNKREESLQASMAAYRAWMARFGQDMVSQRERWVEGLDLLQETSEAIDNLTEGESGKKKRRMLVRTFKGKVKELEDVEWAQEGWKRLEGLEDET